jgi:hypothetical protein
MTKKTAVVDYSAFLNKNVKDFWTTEKQVRYPILTLNFCTFLLLTVVHAVVLWGRSGEGPWDKA